MRAPELYAGVWRAGSDPYALWVGDWGGFRAKWEELAKQNLRLIDLKVYAGGDAIKFAGIWRAGSDPHYLWVGDWNSFRAKWEELSEQNLRLTNLEIYIEGGVTKYSGVWRAGSDAHYLWVGVDWKNFKSKWEELAKQNLRLIDLEVYQESGVTKYAGVWRAGSDAHYLWVGVDWESFKAKWSELSAQNLRLVDLEIYSEGGVTKYAGVWRAGSDAHYLWVGVDWDDFKSKWEELAKENLRLTSFEIYPGISWLDMMETAGETWIYPGDAPAYEWHTLAQSRIALLTHCPNNPEFFRRCHALGIRCFPYVTFFWGGDNVTGTDANHPASSSYQGVQFDKANFYWCDDKAGTPVNATKPGSGYGDGAGFVFWPTGYWTCQNVGAYADAMVSWVAHLMDLGADGVFIDQLFDHGSKACFGASPQVPPDRRHTHLFPDVDPNLPSPSNANKAYLYLLSRVRDAVLKVRPDGAVIGNTWAFNRAVNAPDRLTGLPASYWEVVDVGMIESYLYPDVDRSDPAAILDDAAWAAQWSVWHDYGGPNSPPAFTKGKLQILASVDTAQYIFVKRYNPGDQDVIANLTGEREYAFLAYATARLSGFIWNASSALSNTAVADLYRLRLGPSLSGEHNLGGVGGLYFRVYQRGIVAVNLGQHGAIALPPQAYVNVLVGQQIPPPQRLVDVFLAGAPGRLFQRNQGSDRSATVDAATVKVPSLSGRVFLFGSDLTYHQDFQPTP